MASHKPRVGSMKHSQCTAELIFIIEDDTVAIAAVRNGKLCDRLAWIFHQAGTNQSQPGQLYGTGVIACTLQSLGRLIGKLVLVVDQISTRDDPFNLIQLVRHDKMA